MTAWPTAEVATQSSFTSYFGTQINGSAITWYNSPSVASGNATKDNLRINWVQKLQSNLKIWWNANNADDAASFTGTWDMSDAAVFTDTSNVHTYTTADVTTPKTGSNSDIVWHMQFTNPVSSADVTYDGFYNFSMASVTWDPIDDSTPPSKINFDWRDATPSDLAPTSDFDTTLDTAAVQEDGSTSAACTDGEWTTFTAPVDTDGDPQQCTEFWQLGKSGIACVQVLGQFTRALAATSGPDTTYCDFDLDYISYAVKIQIGQADSDANYVTFSETVDFNLFYPQDGAFSLTSSAMLALAGVLATLF